MITGLSYIPFSFHGFQKVSELDILEKLSKHQSNEIN